MKDKILAIIHGPPELEPVYQLEAEYNKFTNESRKQEFMTEIMSLASTGSIDEKFVSLTIIEFLKKADEAEEVIKRNVNSIDLKKDVKLIPPLLTLSAALSAHWSIRFIEDVISAFKPVANEYSYYYDIGIRTLITTPYWSRALNDIRWSMKNYDDKYAIDFLAFFKWNRTSADVANLYQQLNDDPFIFGKITQLKFQIEFRYESHYLRLGRKN